MGSWTIETSHTERYYQGTTAEALRWRAYSIAKHERIVLQYIMVYDLADGSHRVLDLVLIAGNDRKAKLPTARAVIISGKREALNHTGDYVIDSKEAIDYKPVASLHVRAKLNGPAPKPSGGRGRSLGSKGAENAVRIFVERLARRAHERGLWLPTMAKRRVGLKLKAPLIPDMRYYGVRDSWRVPAHKADEYQRTAKARAQFKKQTAWAFETVEAVDTDGGARA